MNFFLHKTISKFHKIKEMNFKEVSGNWLQEKKSSIIYLEAD
jgi:hypothetical protein